MRCERLRMRKKIHSMRCVRMRAKNAKESGEEDGVLNREKPSFFFFFFKFLEYYCHRNKQKHLSGPASP